MTTRTSSLTWIIGGLLAVVGAVPATAHGLRSGIDVAQATVVTIAHDDGSPFADAAYEIRPPASREAWARGRTDGAGRVVFLPDAVGLWTVKTWSEDGHGTSVYVQVEAGMVPETTASTDDRAGKAVAGLVVIFAVFAALFVAMRRRS